MQLCEPKINICDFSALLHWIVDLISRVCSFSSPFPPKNSAREVLCGARLGIFAVVPGFERSSCFIAVIVSVTHGTSMNQFFLSVNAVKLHNLFPWPCRFFHLPALHF